MGWINQAPQNIDWILLESYTDEQTRGMYIGFSDGKRRLYQRGTRTVTTTVEEARGFDKATAKTICETENAAQRADGQSVSCSYSRANDAGAYTVRKVTVTESKWKGHS